MAFASAINSSNTSPQFEADDNKPRVALDQAGMILHASKEFQNLTNITQYDLGKISLFSLADFTDKSKTIEALESGKHTLKFHTSGNKHTFHFDRITSKNGNKIYVGSLVERTLPRMPNIDRILTPVKTSLSWKKETNNLASVKITHKRRHTDFIPELEPFFDLSGDMMVIVNNEGKIIEKNAKFAEFFTAEDNAPLFSIFHDDDIAAVRRNLRDMIVEPDKAIAEFDARVITGHGAIKTSKWRAQKLGDYIYCMGQDLSALARKQTALERRERELSRAESIGRMGHWEWTVGKEKMEWSAQIFSIFDISADDFKPTIDAMREIIHPDDLYKVDQAFERAIIESNDYDMEFAIKTPQGNTKIIHCEGRCSLDEDGQVQSLYGIMHDITERVEYEHQLMDAKTQAERAYASRTQFLANMSHELRTPLNAVIGFSEMMQKEMLGPIGCDKYKDYIDNIRKSGAHLLDLISDILDMSKIEAGKYELDKTRVNVADILDTACRMIEGRAKDAKIAIYMQDKSEFGDEVMMKADRRAILQIALNILSNAVKFSKENGRVDVDLKATEEKIIFTITDQGIGIPANKLATIGRPFEQVSSDYARNHQGSGLGLAITKELANLHNGTIDIQSQVDIGTKVKVTLPKR